MPEFLLFSLNELIAYTLIALLLSWWFWVLKPIKKPAQTQANWVLFASQSGQAQQLAEQSVKQLNQGDSPNKWQISSLDQWIKSDELQNLDNSQVLLVVSTQGEGDAPDNGRRFLTQLQQHLTPFSHVSFAILGLGDSSYQYFCGFAHTLQKEFTRLGAHPLFELITVDNVNAEHIKQWEQTLSQHFCVANNHAMTSPEFALQGTSAQVLATLIKREKLNPHSPSAPLYALTFELAAPLDFQGGDIAKLTLPLFGQSIIRHYTLANGNKQTAQKSQRVITLLVRQVVINSTTLGQGSGFLTTELALGNQLGLAIQYNPRFHLPPTPAPIIFVVAGSGLAGALGLLEQALYNWGKTCQHWLILGERYPNFDTPCSAKLSQYQQTGLLEKLDLCYSRANPAQNETVYPYVQDALRAQHQELTHWIAKKHAMVYVCGAKQNLQGSIEQVLAHALGEVNFNEFISRGGYREDVY